MNHQRNPLRAGSRVRRIVTRVAVAACLVAVPAMEWPTALAADRPATVPVTSPATAPSTAPSAAPDYAAFTDGFHVPFAKPVDFEHLGSMRVRVCLNGGPPTVFLVDTGSVGTIVSAAEVPNIEPNAPAGSITYSSSGISLEGVWTPVTMTFPDAKDAQGRVPTAVVPVLAAKERKIVPGAVNGGSAKPMLNPKVWMMGIGFGRGKEARPERNPFLNLKEMQAGTMRRGYTITRDGFTLGLAGDKVGPGYLYQKLKDRPVSAETAAMRPGLKDWATARGSVSVAGVRGPDAAVLLDTGLTNMMIGKFDDTAQPEVPEGTPVTVHLMDDQLNYSFKVGDAANPTTPRRVTWVKRADAPTVNTGLRALAVMDYLYDADGGYLGLRPTGKRP
jgi:hypothetical protein